MITVTLIELNGHECSTEVDPGPAPYPLTIRMLRLPDLTEFVRNPQRSLQRVLDQQRDHADAAAYLHRMAQLTEEERAADDHARWRTFTLIDPDRLRYQEEP